MLRQFGDYPADGFASNSILFHACLGKGVACSISSKGPLYRPDEPSCAWARSAWVV